MKKIFRFLKWNLLRPIQKLIRGWAYSDLWNLDSHLAKTIYPRLKAFVESYRKGEMSGLCPGSLLVEYRTQLISEGFQFDKDSRFFQVLPYI
jgi:hypothetical protein